MPTILLRRGTSAEWATANPVLGAGELGVDLTQGKMKLGDGISSWFVLPFMGGGGGGGNPSWGDITGTISAQADLQAVLNSKEPLLSAGTSGQYLRGDKSWQTLNKLAVGLGNVDNTSDLDKPISTASQVSLDAKQTTLVSGTNIKTINGQSVLGSGNIVVAGGGGGNSYFPSGF